MRSRSAAPPRLLERRGAGWPPPSSRRARASAASGAERCRGRRAAFGPFCSRWCDGGPVLHAARAVLPLALVLVAHGMRRPASPPSAHRARPCGRRRRLLVAGSGVGAALVAVVLVLLLLPAGRGRRRSGAARTVHTAASRSGPSATRLQHQHEPTSLLLVGAERLRLAPAFVIEHLTHGLVVSTAAFRGRRARRRGGAPDPAPLFFESRGWPGRTPTRRCARAASIRAQSRWS